jgi:hypothetical protein
MTPELQRFKIAEACGWRYLGPVEGTPREEWCNPSGFMMADPPDYLNDLNAMHDAETWLYKASASPINKDGLTAEWRDKQKTAWVAYLFNLNRIVNYHPSTYPTHHHDWVRVHATAPQRAEAFLRTLNLWIP